MEAVEKIEDMIQPRAAGTRTDIAAGVEISKVHGGYFSSAEKAKTFCDVGLSQILTELPASIRYADFGGSEGFLAKVVATYLREHGKEVDVSVVDANEKSIEVVKMEGLHAVLANLQDCNIGNLNLITMRAVNHYNSWKDQITMMKNAHANLAERGFLVNQLSSGSKENVMLRTEIVSLPSLIYGSALGKSGYQWISEEEYKMLCVEAGFYDTQRTGYAPSNAWEPEEQWERMNGKRLHEAEMAGDTQLVEALQVHREKLISDANLLVEGYLKKTDSKTLGVERTEGGSYIVHYTYPIFTSLK